MHFIFLFVICFTIGNASFYSEGDIGDAKCSVESVEFAITGAFKEILSELLNCTYLRLFRVNMNKDCAFWTKPKLNPCEETCGLTPPEEESREEEQCTATCTLDSEDQSTAGHFSVDWSPPTDDVDKSVTKQERKANQEGEEGKAHCLTGTASDADPSAFWQDMCTDIGHDESDYINLQLNPERNTGYNGSHLWQAIYEENCFKRAGTVENMCYEERVLYRLLSGMHAAINIQISIMFYPPIKGVRDEWMPNPRKFVELFGENPERLKNLHFGFVVLLRSLFLASPYLRQHSFSIGAPDDLKVQKLVNLFFDSSILQSCQSIYTAFDEKLLFRDGSGDHVTQTPAPHTSAFPTENTADKEHEIEDRLLSLKQQFKGVFRNISKILDCVSCQKCKLHAKVALLGIGTALKILLSQSESQLKSTCTSLQREEVVALFNTIARWSEAITNTQELAALYEESLQSMQPLITKKDKTKNIDEMSDSAKQNYLTEFTLKTIASLAKEKRLSVSDESRLVSLVLSQSPLFFAFASAYHDQAQDKFIGLLIRNADKLSPSEHENRGELHYDAVIIGGGLAGLTTALSLLDKGATVAILEKERFFGGNSAWASSGINGIDTNLHHELDSVDVFRADMMKSAGYNTNSSLIEKFTSKSGDSLAWLRQRVGMHLDDRGRLGGHSYPRTYRPKEGIAGASLIYNIAKLIEKEPWGNRLSIFKSSQAVSLRQNGEGDVIGVHYIRNGEKERLLSLSSDHVILASGGYAHDYSDDSLLMQSYRAYPTTNGRWSTGDGQKMAIKAGAGVVDIDKVQIHPTGFVDPKDEANTIKILAGEILRGEGGILLDDTGKRFCNELDTRDSIVARMKSVKKDKFILLLNEQTALATRTHIDMYLRKQLIQKYDSLTAFCEHFSLDASAVVATLNDYNKAAEFGTDEWGKVFFHGVPWKLDGSYYAGIVTPVVHYCMGGITINENGQVLNKMGAVIKGLLAAGEIIGGLHGKNRLGGNALTECVVFGKIIADGISIDPSRSAQTSRDWDDSGKRMPTELVNITTEELATHHNSNSCWVAIDGKVFDFTSFIDDHPGGAASVTALCGSDGTRAFRDVHAMEMLDDFSPIFSWTDSRSV